MAPANPPEAFDVLCEGSPSLSAFLLVFLSPLFFFDLDDSGLSSLSAAVVAGGIAEALALCAAASFFSPPPTALLDALCLFADLGAGYGAGAATGGARVSSTT